MSDMIIQLSSGRSVSVRRFAFIPSYENILEGSIEQINEYILENVPKKAALLLFSRSIPTDCPVYVRTPTSDNQVSKFPDYICFALLHGSVVMGRPDSDDEFLYGSRMGYCWFTNKLNLPLLDLVLSGLEPFAWDEIAENWGI